MSLQVQFATLGAMFASGLILGMAFDLLRAISREFHVPRRIISLMDLVYWVAATGFVFQVLARSNSGQLRFFVFIGLGIGFCFHFGLLSGLALNVFHRMLRMFVAIARFLIRLADWLILKPLLALYRLLLLLGGFFVTVTIFLLRIVIQLLYPMRWLAVKLLGPLAAKMGLGELAAQAVGLGKRLWAWPIRLWKRLF